MNEDGPLGKICAAMFSSSVDSSFIVHLTSLSSLSVENEILYFYKQCLSGLIVHLDSSQCSNILNCY